MLFVQIGPKSKSHTELSINRIKRANEAIFFVKFECQKSLVIAYRKLLLNIL